jgi:hypothetical protein
MAVGEGMMKKVTGRKSPTDLENPEHYAQQAIQPAEYIMQNEMDWWRGNTIKYVSRAGLKVGPGSTAEEAEIDDLIKARRMIEMRLNQLRGVRIDFQG